MWRQHLYQPQYDIRESYEEHGAPSSPPPGRLRRLINHLKENKGRILARALGGIGANYLYSKASGRKFTDDLGSGPLGFAGRYVATGTGAAIGDTLYHHFKNR